MTDRIESGPNPTNRTAWKVEMEAFFSDPRADQLHVTPGQLRRWMILMTEGHDPAEKLQREINRGITINHIQTPLLINQLEETMRRLNAANDKTQLRIGILTVIAV